MGEFSPDYIFAAGGRMMWLRKFGHLSKDEQKTATLSFSGNDEILDFIGSLDYAGLKQLRKIARDTTISIEEERRLQ
jgi:hypothetical protein